MNEEIHHLNAEEYQILNNVETFQTSPSLIDRISVNNEEGEILSDLEDDSLHSTHIPFNKIVDTPKSKEEKVPEGSYKSSLRNSVNEKTADDCSQPKVADRQDGALEEGELSDTPVGDEASAKSNICRYFSRFGSCNRGNQCKFLHIYPSSNTNQNHPGRIIITNNSKSTLLSTSPIVVTSCCVRDSTTAVDTVAGGNVPESNQNNGVITVADSNAVESSNIKTPQNSDDKGKGESLINITTRGGAASAWERGLAQAKKLNSAKRQAVSADVAMTTTTADVLAVKEERRDYHGNHQEVGRTKLVPAKYRQLLDHKEGDGDDYEREYSLHPPYSHFGRNYGPPFILPPPRHPGVTRGTGPPPYYYPPPPPRAGNWGHPPPLYPPPHHRRTFTGPYDTYVPPPPPPLLSNNYYPDIYLDMVEGKERGRESPVLAHHPPSGVDLRDHLVWRRRRRRCFNDSAVPEETADSKSADAVTDQLSALPSTPSSSDDDELPEKTRNSSHNNLKLPQTDDQSIGKRNKPDDEWHDPWARDRGTKTNIVTHQRRYFESAEGIQNDEFNNSSDRVNERKNQNNVEKKFFPTDKSGRRYQQHDTALSSDYYNYHYSNYSRYPPSHHDRSYYHYDSTFDTNSTRNDLLSHTNNSNKRIKSAVVRAANIHKENFDDNFLQDNKRSYPKKGNKSSIVSSNSSNTTSQTSTRSSSSSTTSSSCSEKSSAKSTINTTQNEKYAPCSADLDAISSGSATSNSSNSITKSSPDHINSLDKSRKSFKLDNHLMESKTMEKTDVLNIKSAYPIQKNAKIVNESKSKIPKPSQYSRANKKEKEMSDISSDSQFSDGETNLKSHHPTQKMHKTKDLNQKDIKNGESQIIPNANMVKHPSESDLESISSDDSLETESISDKIAVKKANKPHLLPDNENVKSCIIQKKKPNSNYDNTINVNQSKRYSNDKNEQEMKFNKEDGSKTIKKNINIISSKNSNDKNARREQLLKELKEVEMAIAKKLGK